MAWMKSKQAQNSNKIRVKLIIIYVIIYLGKIINNMQIYQIKEKGASAIRSIFGETNEHAYYSDTGIW